MAIEFINFAKVNQETGKVKRIKVMNYSEYSVPTQKRSEIETSHQFVSAVEKAVG